VTPNYWETPQGREVIAAASSGSGNLLGVGNQSSTDMAGWSAAPSRRDSTLGLRFEVQRVPGAAPRAPTGQPSDYAPRNSEDRWWFNFNHDPIPAPKVEVVDPWRWRGVPPWPAGMVQRPFPAAPRWPPVEAQSPEQPPDQPTDQSAQSYLPNQSAGSRSWPAAAVNPLLAMLTLGWLDHRPQSNYFEGFTQFNDPSRQFRGG